MSNTSPRQPFGNDGGTGNTPGSPSMESIPATRPEFSLMRVLATVLLLGGLAAGGYLFLNQEKTLPPLVEFKGQVFYKDKPLTTGGIFTETIEPGLIGAVGALDQEGRFTLMTNGVPGAYVGRHKLAVSAMGLGSPPAPLIPVHYIQPLSSNLFIDVTTDPARNTCEFRLVDDEQQKIQLPSAAEQEVQEKQ